MAQKKSTGETKAKTTRSTSASGKSGAKSNKSAQTPTPSPAKRALAGFAMQAGPYIWAICALLLAVCLLAGDGIVGGAIQRLFCGLFGVMAYTLPLYFLYIVRLHVNRFTFYILDFFKCLRTFQDNLLPKFPKPHSFRKLL